jgi:putative tricarboxylic transport membrane protein
MSGASRHIDRILGGLIVLLAAVVAFEARTFVVSFLTDPLGARAIPLFVAALLGLGGILVALRPEPESDWPNRRVWRVIALSVMSFLLYAALLYPVGFVVATIAEVFVLAMLFGGPPLKSLVGAGVFSGLLYLLFAYLLGLSLPVGAVFQVS